MRLYSNTDSYKLYQGNMLDLEMGIKPNSIDSIITDPPYELGFMGKGWDSSGVAFQKDTWQHCLNVLKPGCSFLSLFSIWPKVSLSAPPNSFCFFPTSRKSGIDDFS